MANEMSEMRMGAVLGESIALGPVPFNLYSLDSGGSMVLFCRAGYEITPQQKEMLGQAGRVFYVTSDERPTYLDYATERVDEVLANPSIDKGEKVEFMKSVGKRAVERFLDDPRSGREVERTGSFVSSYVDLVLDFPGVKTDLFTVASYGLYLLSHSFNVCTLCLLLGEKMFGKDRRQLWQLGMGGLLHDVGMTGIDKAIIDKPDKLSADEMKLVRKHPLDGHEILSRHELPNTVLLMTRHHHERGDGSGYPDGLATGEAHQYALVAAVADTYDAMTSDRSYKPMKQHLDALEEMAGLKGLYDGEVFDALLSVVLVHETIVEQFKNNNLPGKPEA